MPGNLMSALHAILIFCNSMQNTVIETRYCLKYSIKNSKLLLICIFIELISQLSCVGAVGISVLYVESITYILISNKGVNSC